MDVVDTKLWTEHGTVTDFACNYRAKIHGRWHEVRRYDSCHGATHIHSFWREEQDQIREVDATLGSTRSAILTLAQSDFRTNWERYRQLMEAKVG